MPKQTSILQNTKLNLIFAAIGAVGGLTALLLYKQRRDNAKLQSELLKQQKELTQLNIEAAQRRKLEGGI